MPTPSPLSVFVRREVYGELVARLRDVMESVPPPAPPAFYAGLTGVSPDNPKYPLLASIDPGGRTIFNSRQMQLLLAELAALKPTLAGSELRTATALEVLILAHGASPHHYLWFHENAGL